MRLGDGRALLLVEQLQSSQAAGAPRAALLAQVEAWQGRFQEAAKLFVQAGKIGKVGGGA